MMRLFVTVLSAAAMIQASTTIALAAAATAAFTQPASIAVTLVSETTSYKTGDTVRLKIVVRNASASPLSLLFSGPQNDSQLSIRDAAGALVAADTRPTGPLFNTSGSVAPTALQPGESVPDTEYALGMPSDVQSSPEFAQGFVPTSWWGYTLSKPGRYTIVARRVLVPPGVSPSASAGIFSAWSNPVVISVTP